MASATPTYIVNATTIDFDSISTMVDEGMKSVLQRLKNLDFVDSLIFLLRLC